MDTRLFLHVEQIARTTNWAHGPMRAISLYGAAVALGAVLMVCWWRSRSTDLHQGNPSPSPGVPTALWTIIAVVLAVGLGAAFSQAVGREPPFRTVHGVLVLVPRTGTFSFPDRAACAAGAAVVGITLFRNAVTTILAWLIALLWAFAEVYVGVAFPGDVLAGLLLGGLVVGVLQPAGVFFLGPLVRATGKTRLWPLVAQHRLEQGAR
jgi:undecaprenyl-diphosphatase